MMGLNNIGFKASAKLLEDPNVFIGDTRALSNTAASNLGFRNKRAAQALDSITNVTGNDLDRKKVGDVTGTFCDKYGKETSSAVIKDMVCSPSLEFNLFSLTKRLKDAYSLGAKKM